MTAVAFRADSSSEIGGGHVMRCLALADELRNLGSDVRFVCRELPGNLNRVIAERKFIVSALPAAPHARAVDWQTDASQTLAALPAAPAWLVVDHYCLGDAWERALRQTGAGNILAIDDLGRPHECEVVLDQNTTDRARYDDLVPAACRRLLGPDFALLQRAFVRQRRTIRKREGALERVLVSFGNADATNQTPKAMRALGEPQFSELAIDVVLGRSNANADKVREACTSLRNARFHLGVDNMAEMMAAADLAIGAAGSMTWERACLGLPALTLVCAENQRAPAETAARHGAAIDLGWRDDVTEQTIAEAVRELRGDPFKLWHMSEAGMRLVDGQGARRVAEEILGFELSAASFDDAEQIWRWANDATVRAHAFNSEPIPLASHLRWYAERLRDPRCRIYVARVGAQAVGQMRFEIEGDRATVDISVDPAWRGRGIGSRVLEMGLAELRARWPHVKAVGEVKGANAESQALFRAAGFSQRPSARSGVVEFLLECE